MKTRTLLLAGVAVLTLAACGDDEPAPTSETRIYGSLPACLDDATNMEDVQVCRDGYTKSLERIASAPKFDQQAKCEETYGPGNCARVQQTTEGGGSVWLPAMVGFMIGRQFGSSGNLYSFDPIYRDRQGYAYSPSRGRLELPPETDDQRRRDMVYTSYGYGPSGSTASSGSGGSSWSVGDWSSSSSSSSSSSTSSSSGKSTSSVWKSSPRGTSGSISNASYSRGSVSSGSSVSRGGFGSTASLHSGSGG
jgi:uncharacterized protein YgiB involved in biofilm formation